MKNKQCAECRDGEHDNYDEKVILVTVRDTDGKLFRRANMCESHREAYADDGYNVQEA